MPQDADFTNEPYTEIPELETEPARHERPGGFDFGEPPPRPERPGGRAYGEDEDWSSADFSFDPLDPEENVEPDVTPEVKRENLRGSITWGLIGVLAFVIVSAFITLWFGATTTDDLVRVLNVVFTPLIAMLGSALGFYFGGQAAGKG